MNKRFIYRVKFVGWSIFLGTVCAFALWGSLVFLHNIIFELSTTPYWGERGTEPTPAGKRILGAVGLVKSTTSDFFGSESAEARELFLAPGMVCAGAFALEPAAETSPFPFSAPFSD